MALTLLPGSGREIQPRSPAPRRHPLQGAALRRIGVLDYDDGHGLYFQAVDIPRLSSLRRTWPAEDRRETFWLVDGEPVLDLDEAAERLELPPEISAGELAVLNDVPHEWTAPSDLRALMRAGLPHAAGHARVRLLGKLLDKGLLEVAASHVRRRPNAEFRL